MWWGTPRCPHHTLCPTPHPHRTHPGTDFPKRASFALPYLSSRTVPHRTRTTRTRCLSVRGVAHRTHCATPRPHHTHCAAGVRCEGSPRPSRSSYFGREGGSGKGGGWPATLPSTTRTVLRAVHASVPPDPLISAALSSTGGGWMAMLSLTPYPLSSSLSGRERTGVWVCG